MLTFVWCGNFKNLFLFCEKFYYHKFLRKFKAFKFLKNFKLVAACSNINKTFDVENVNEPTTKAWPNITKPAVHTIRFQSQKSIISFMQYTNGREYSKLKIQDFDT